MTNFVESNPAHTVELLEQARALFDLIFDPTDSVLIRLIETWADGGKKSSRIVHRHSGHWLASDLTDRLAMLALHAEREHAGVHFGVAPRFSPDGEVWSGYDLAWQVRTVRCLWADIDDALPDETLKRIELAKLPRPSALVMSGRGTHCYWALAEPFVIDDAPSPPPRVREEWITLQDGGKRPVQWFEDEVGERVNLHSPQTGKPLPQNRPELSPKALLVQDVIAAIAAKIGGDSVSDLARLLRCPGVMNRKDARNGREPVLCELVECSGARYPFSDFAHLANGSPSAQRRVAIAAVPLPTTQPRGTKWKRTLEDLIVDCSAAPAGQRSERDFALVCFAVERGLLADEVWTRVSSIGKFAERGESYFKRTWEKAAGHTREKLYERAVQRIEARTSADNTDSDEEDGPPSDEHTIEISPGTPVKTTLASITDALLSTKQIYCRAGQPVMIANGQIKAITESKELAGILSTTTEVVVCSGERRNHEPLPPRFGSTWLGNPNETARLPAISLFTRAPAFTMGYRLCSPGFDPDSGVYYAGVALTPSDSREHLDALLDGFCFRSPADRTNFVALLLTIPLISGFIGSKPGAIISANQPSVGKSTLAQIVAVLKDGCQTETVSYSDDDSEFEKRLAARVRSGATTIIVDNAKGNGAGSRRGQNVCISSPCLERSITDRTLSFRLLGFSSEIRAENSHIFILTANSAECDRDLVTRCLPINLFHEGDPTRRNFAIADPEGYAEEHREEILCELLGMVERWKAAGMPLADVATRFNKKGWGRVIGGILECNGEPDFLANLDEASLEFDSVRRDFAELVMHVADELAAKGETRATANDWARIAVAKGLLRNELGGGSPRSQATRMGGNILSRFVGEEFEVPERLFSGVLVFDQGPKGPEGPADSASWSVELPTTEEKKVRAKIFRRESGKNRTYEFVQE